MRKVRILYAGTKQNWIGLFSQIHRGVLFRTFEPIPARPCVNSDTFRDIQLSDHGRLLCGVVPWVVLFHISGFFWLRQRGTVSETEQARWLYRCQPWFYLRLGA
jgi:hypothetical protein